MPTRSGGLYLLVDVPLPAAKVTATANARARARVRATARATAQARLHARRLPKSKPTKAIRGAGRATTFPTGLAPLNPTGLTNPGRYCYRISVLQCLADLPAVYNYLGVIDHQSVCEEAITRCVLCALQTLVNRYWNEEGRSSFPTRATKLLDTAHAHEKPLEHDANGMGLNQSDPHEYFHFLHTQIEQHEQTRLLQLFNVALRSNWTCVDCDTVHYASDDPRTGLDISLNDHTKLGLEHEHLNHHLWSLFHETSNQRCDSDVCQSRELKEREIEFQIEKAPEVLVIYLNRMGYTVDEETKENYTLTKTDEFVPYPEVLDLSEWTTDGSDLMYRLYGVIAHSGAEDGDFGHYISVVRQISHRFRVIDNNHAMTPSEAKPDNLLNPHNKSVQFNTGLLFYVRISP